MRNSIPVLISTTEYQAAHGHQPRGRGSWAFHMQGLHDIFWVHNSTYGEAKKQAIQRARNRAIACCQIVSWISVGA
jgi:hypothetical protein